MVLAILKGEFFVEVFFLLGRCLIDELLSLLLRGFPFIMGRFGFAELRFGDASLPELREEIILWLALAHFKTCRASCQRPLANARLAPIEGLVLAHGEAAEDFATAERRLSSLKAATLALLGLL